MLSSNSLSSTCFSTTQLTVDRLECLKPLEVEALAVQRRQRRAATTTHPTLHYCRPPLTLGNFLCRLSKQGGGREVCRWKKGTELTREREAHTERSGFPPSRIGWLVRGGEAGSWRQESRTAAPRPTLSLAAEHRPAEQSPGQLVSACVVHLPTLILHPEKPMFCPQAEVGG